MKAMHDSSVNYETLIDMINELGLSSEEVVDLFVNYHGLQLLSHDFIENMIKDYDLDEEEEDY